MERTKFHKAESSATQDEGVLRFSVILRFPNILIFSKVMCRIAEYIIILAGDPNKLIRRTRTWEISFSCSLAKDIEVSLYDAPNVIINSFNINLGNEKVQGLLKFC